MKSLTFAAPLAFALCAASSAPAWADEPPTSVSESTQPTSSEAAQTEPASSEPAPPPTYPRTFSSAPAPGSPAAEPKTEMNSPALLVTGIAVGGYGLTSAVISAVAIGETGACGCTAVYPNDCDMTGCKIGIAHIFAGPVLVLGAIPMIVAGAWEIPSSDRGVPPTTAEVRVGPGNTSVAVTF